MSILSVLAMAAALGAGEPAEDQDGVVATAPATSVDLSVTAQPHAPSVEGSVQAVTAHNLTTDEQIRRWIAARDPEARPYSALDDGDLIRDDRKPHGEVSVGFGTGGYRQYGATVSMPLGENGRLNLSFTQVENGFGYYPYGYGYGGYPYGHGFGRGYALSPFGFDDVDYGSRARTRGEFETRIGDPDTRRPKPRED